MRWLRRAVISGKEGQQEKVIRRIRWRTTLQSLAGPPYEYRHQTTSSDVIWIYNSDKYTMCQRRNVDAVAKNRYTARDENFDDPAEQKPGIFI